jgi:indolepyruvate ferredoxin oxidoreductase beta subunit
MKILIPSIGGLGVGVFVEWLSAAAILEGLKPNVLSLPGVSQRTGRTLSYMEISNGEAPFSPFPEKGNLDLIISQEFLELLHTLKEGYGWKGCNILGTTFRYYTTYEKLSLKRDIYTYENFRSVIEDNSKDHIVVDIHKMGIADFSNAHLLGLLCASGYLPIIRRESYEEAIKAVGIEPEKNLRDFAFGYDLLKKEGSGVLPYAPTINQTPTLPEGYIKESIERLESIYGKDVRDVLVEALRQLVAYQDIKYGEFYITRVNDLHSYISLTIGETEEFKELIREFAKVLAVRMMYEDIIRVAENKTSKERFERIKRLYRIQNTDVYWVRDFFRPELDEIYGILPDSLGKVLDRMLSRHRISLKTEISTNHILGFLLLKGMSKMRFLRRRSFRYKRENTLIEKYVEHVKRCLIHGRASALLSAKGGAVIRGYGDVRKEMIRRWEEFASLMNPRIMSSFLDNLFSEKRFES